VPAPRIPVGGTRGVPAALQEQDDRCGEQRQRHRPHPVLHRRLARCQNGSANWAKAKAKVARAHRKVRNARSDFLHRVSTHLVRDNDMIVIEDLAVHNMVRNRHLARSISACGWGEFRRQLEYKCQRYGRQLIVIDRWYPSSKTCSACGHLLATLTLGARQWTCPSCGTRHDRDVNAAKNILAAGQAVTACGADVRHPGTPGCDRR
jgi:putative transposase